MSKLLLSVLFSAGFLLIGVCIFLVTVPPCALSQFNIFDRSCVGQSKIKKTVDTVSIQALETRLAALKLEAMNKNCAYNSFSLRKDISNDREILTSEEVTGFNDRDLGKLSGCWEFIGSKQEFAPVDCYGDNCMLVPSSNARYCFSGAGTGTVETELSGYYCRGDIIANFDTTDGSTPILSFDEPEGQICDKGAAYTKLISRSYKCNLNSEFRINYITTNSMGDSAQILLRRIDNGDK